MRAGELVENLVFIGFCGGIGRMESGFRGPVSGLVPLASAAKNTEHNNSFSVK
jgi:hypothetical protein